MVKRGTLQGKTNGLHARKVIRRGLAYRATEKEREKEYSHTRAD